MFCLMRSSSASRICYESLKVRLFNYLEVLVQTSLLKFHLISKSCLSANLRKPFSSKDYIY